jgi:hypothetical protein
MEENVEFRKLMYEGLNKVLRGRYRSLKEKEKENYSNLRNHLNQILQDLKYEYFEPVKEDIIYSEEERQFLRDIKEFLINHNYILKRENERFNVHLLRVYDDLEFLVSK